MDQNNSQELDLNQNNEVIDEQLLKDTSDTVSQSYNYTQSQLQWMNRQVSNLERELLLNNRPLNTNFISNWAKVIISVLAAIIPGIGQIIGIVLGLVFVSSDDNVDKRSFGAALITVSMVVFVISALFWFVFAVTFGPQIYY